MLSFLLFLTLTSLSGCLRGAQKPHSQSSGVKATDFRLETITGESISDILHEVWKFPIQKTYSFRVCLIGRATTAQLPSGQKFVVVNPHTHSVQPVTTDDQGCFNWNENQAFNFTADSVYIKKDRIIKGAGGTYKGEMPISLGVNPWLEYRNDNGNEVVDLNRTKVVSQNNIIEEVATNSLKGGLFRRGQQGSQLLIDPDINLKLTPEKNLSNGKQIRFTLRVKPYIEALNLRGEPVRYDLTTGKFRIFAQLVSANVGRNQTQHVLLTQNLRREEIEIKNSGTIAMTSVFKLDRQVQMGFVRLALQIVPIESPVHIGSYEALHNVGKFNSLLDGAQAIQIKGPLSQENFNYATYIKTATNFEELKKEGFAKDLPPVDFEPMDGRFVRIASGETSTHRTVVYRVSTVVTDSITGEVVADQPFKVKKHFTGNEEEIWSDKWGVIRWVDELNHAYYMPEQYFFPKFSITDETSGYTQTLTLGINPWDEGWTFAEDIRGNEQRFRELSETRVRNPLFVIDAFRYQTIRFRYVIDEYLTLNVKKAVVMALDPLVQRFTIKDGRKFEPLRDGIYLVKVALVKFYIDPFQNNTRLIKDPNSEGYYLQRIGTDENANKGEYTTIIKKLVRVQAGRITTPLEFSMRDLRMMSIRSTIMVQIETIDESKLTRDDIINHKLDEALEQYIKANSENMNELEKAAYIAEIREHHEKEVAQLKNIIEKEIPKLQEKRKADSDFYAERAHSMDQLVKRLGRVTSQSDDADKAPFDNFDKQTESEYRNALNDVRKNIVNLELQMREYWDKWEKEWQEDQLKSTFEDGLMQIPMEHLSSRPSYLDYLGQMQIFLDSFGLGIVLGSSDLEKLEINNYTVTSVNPLLDLNLYTTYSGLEKRTFLGPCTLVENDNMSELRPTDTIDESKCESDYCSQDVVKQELERLKKIEEEFKKEKNEVRQGLADSFNDYSTESGEYQDQMIDLTKARADYEDNLIFEGSAYHDSFKPYAIQYKHVDKIIDLHVKNEFQYQREMLAISQLGNFVEQNNLDYVSLTDQPLRKYKQGCDFKDERQCFIPVEDRVSSVESFLDSLNKAKAKDLLQRYFYVKPLSYMENLNKEIVRTNSLEPLWEKTSNVISRLFDWGLPWETSSVPYSERGLGNRYLKTAKDYLNTHFHGEEDFYIDTKRVQGWLANGLDGLELIDALKVCHVLAHQTEFSLRAKGLLKPETQSLWSFDKPLRTSKDYLLEYCFSKIHYFPDTNQVVVDGLTFDRRMKALRTGRNVLRAGKNINVNVGKDFSISSYNDINSVATLGINGGALMGPVAAGIGAVSKLAGGTARLAGNLVIAQGTINSSSGVNMATNTAVSSAVLLVIQKAEIELTIKEHEKCMITQFTPDFIKGLNLNKLRVRDGVKADNLDLLNEFTRGLFICGGEIIKEPVNVMEDYYYVTQHFTAGDMLDEANLLNHVWLLALRGERDFNNFIRIIEAKEVNSKGEILKEAYDYSLAHLERVYQKVLPSFPGLYTVKDTRPISKPKK